MQRIKLADKVQYKEKTYTVTGVCVEKDEVNKIMIVYEGKTIIIKASEVKQIWVEEHRYNDRMNNTTTVTSFEDTWANAFTQYLYLGDMMKNILRNSATRRLVNRGFEEVGSSDVNHELFAMWQSANYDWQKAAVVAVNDFAASLR